jgi:hypothetical protein
MDKLRQLFCEHDWRNGETYPPYKPPYCAKCGKVLATRAGITYADFMSKAEAVFDSGVKIETAKIDPCTVTANMWRFKAGQVIILPETIKDAGGVCWRVDGWCEVSTFDDRAIGERVFIPGLCELDTE